MSNAFQVGDVVVCTDDSPWAGGYRGVWRELAEGKLYEVVEGTDHLNVVVKWVDGRWKVSRFRRATSQELLKFRMESGFENHQFQKGDIVVGIADDIPQTLGKSFEVSSVHKDTRDGECFVGLNGDDYAGFGAFRFRKATPEEAVEHRKKPKVATFTAGEDLKEGRLVTVQIGDSKPFKAVVCDKPTDAVNGKFTVPEITLSVSFELEPVKAPVTRPACAESITEAPKVEAPKSGFDGIGYKPRWEPKVGDWVRVKKPLFEHWLNKWPLWTRGMDKYDGLVAQVVSIVRGDRVRFEEPKGGRPSDCVGGGYYYHFDWLEPVEAPVSQAPAPEKEKTFAEYRELRRAKGPGEGHRFMSPEELVVEGDEFDDTLGGAEPRWEPSRNWLDGKQARNIQYRRRNQFAVGELVRVVKPSEDERKKFPHWTEGMDYLDGKVFEMSETLTEEGRILIFAPSDLGKRGWTLAVDWLAPASPRQKAAYEAAKAEAQAPAPEVPKDEAPAKREPTKTEILLGRRIMELVEMLKGAINTRNAVHNALVHIGRQLQSYADKTDGLQEEAEDTFDDLLRNLAEDFPELFTVSEGKKKQS